MGHPDLESPEIPNNQIHRESNECARPNVPLPTGDLPSGYEYALSKQLPLYSHSIVAGGLLEISKVTRDISLISLMMRDETRSRNS